jgi:hypothetical protein
MRLAIAELTRVKLNVKRVLRIATRNDERSLLVFVCAAEFNNHRAKRKLK